MDFQSILQNWLTSFIDFFPKVVAALVIFLVTIVGAGFVAKSVRKFSAKKITSPELLQLIFRVTRWTLLIVGTIVALDQVNFNVTGFIAGLGVAGFTIGFALQDIAKNFISGLLLLYRQPFVIGDAVKISTFTGIITQINIRDTVLKTYDGELVIIPNQEVFENPIVNYTHTKLRRQSVTIRLGYKEDSDQAVGVFLDAVKGIEGVEVSPAPSIYVSDLGESALILTTYYWCDQKDENVLDVQSKVITAIKKAAETNGISLPSPIKTVRLEK
ncbi:MAG: mechanosensitive ion channel family protein [Anaerolineaceae bacterium]|nr:mechanosensitive ion channel family protein [Anaerolineaceae bacterium]